METSAPRSKFNAFRARKLRNPAIRAAYEDSRTRNGLIDALVRRRRFLGLSQTAVAKAMGVGQPTVSGFETEGSDPRLSTLQRYARAVHATIVVEVVPIGRPAGSYFQHDVGVASHAERSDTTDRAVHWSQTAPQHPWRHLKAV